MRKVVIEFRDWEAMHRVQMFVAQITPAMRGDAARHARMVQRTHPYLLRHDGVLQNVWLPSGRTESWRRGVWQI